MSTVTPFTNSDQVRTTDNAETNCVLADLASYDHCTAGFTIFVLARSTTGVSAKWLLSFTAERATGNAAIVASLVNQVALERDLGALTWTASADVDGTLLRIRVKGQNGLTIDWYGAFDGQILQA